MTGQPLRLTEPGELPAPRTDADSAAVLAEAVDTLAALRTPCWLGDSAVGLHALASLIAQAHTMIPDAVHAARGQPTPFTRPAAKATPGPRPAGCSTSPRQPPPADTGTIHDRLDNDHPHNARGAFAPRAEGRRS